MVTLTGDVAREALIYWPVAPTLNFAKRKSRERPATKDAPRTASGLRDTTVLKPTSEVAPNTDIAAIARMNKDAGGVPTVSALPAA